MIVLVKMILKVNNFCTVFVLIFITFNCFVYSYKFPTITYITPKIIKDIGDSTELTCTVLNALDYTVLWEKIDKEGFDDPYVLSIESKLIIENSRYSVKKIDGTSTYKLKIKNIQKTDVGFYQCQLSLGFKKQVSAEVELVVRQPPVIYDNTTRSLLLVEGQTAVLRCYAGGYPRPTIFWRRENYEILPTGGSINRSDILTIPNITKEYHGTYYCLAKNDVGQCARRSIAVMVLFVPVIKVLRPNLTQALQYGIDLKCHVKGYPLPTVTWVFNKDKLSNNHSYSITQHTISVELLETVLHITSIQTHQYGEYICEAKNFFGTTNASIIVSESVIPVCPPACIINPELLNRIISDIIVWLWLVAYTIINP